jgi:hypothetical protein
MDTIMLTAAEGFTGRRMTARLTASGRPSSSTTRDLAPSEVGARDFTSRWRGVRRASGVRRLTL